MRNIIRITLEIAEKRDIDSAFYLQKTLIDKVVLEGRPSLDTILGFDAAYIEGREGEKIISGLVVLNRAEDTFSLTHKFYSIDKISFPYIPGLFSFREGVGFIKVWEKVPRDIKNTIDLILVDGHGIYHPRGLGLASHIGLITDKPTIGCAKQGFGGDYEIPGMDKGDWEWIMLNGKKVGIVLRTKRGVKPIWVSPGHLISLDHLHNALFPLVGKYRIPYPLREVHIFVQKIKKEMKLKDI